MVHFYVLMIKIGKITIDKVPSRFRDAVQAEIDAESEE